MKNSDVTTSYRILRLRPRLLEWGKENIQHYPWRFNNSLYRVLVAEFMLHRTQAVQVESVYVQFINLWPTLEAWSQADVTEAETVLASLGLRWRIRAMIEALNQLWSEYGRIPSSIEKLKAIHGIGPYIAGATVCFAQNRPVALVDTNTVRVIGRILDLNLSGEARRRQTVIRAIEESCHPEQPREFYYALIDLAHEICTLSQPDCSRCPLLEVPCTFGEDTDTVPS
jgi:A/G-specific adenine glycosylase